MGLLHTKLKWKEKSWTFEAPVKGKKVERLVRMYGLATWRKEIPLRSILK